MTLDGQAVDYPHAAEAIDGGVVYLTEDRKALGPVSRHDRRRQHQSRRHRPRCAGSAAGSICARGRLRSLAAIKALTIRVPGPEIPVGALSGGNQQKVLLSRLLETQPKVLILDEPTRGVDIGAKSEIYRIIDELAQSGAACCDHQLGTAGDRRHRRPRRGDARRAKRAARSAAAPASPITEESIMALATGVDIDEAWQRRATTPRQTSRQDGHVDDRPSALRPRARAADRLRWHACASLGMLPVLIDPGHCCPGFGGIYFTGEGRFLTWQNLSIVAQQASINAVLAAGMTFVILTGGIDLSVGSILAAAAMWRSIAR